jgi:alpha,alpha-trehalase
MEFRRALTETPSEALQSSAIETESADQHEKVAGISPADTLTPADRYQELFVGVQMSRVFEDSKTFVDCVPLEPPARILEKYRSACFNQNFDLRAFVRDHFGREELPPNCFVADPNRTLEEPSKHSGPC